MPSAKGDEAYLWDMLDAAQTVVQITAGVELNAYLKNRTVQLAVERAVEIIGEAARYVSDEFRAQHAEIPWSKIVGLRHVLAHHYGAIEQERMWRVAQTHVPELVVLLTPLVPHLPLEAPGENGPSNGAQVDSTRGSTPEAR